MNLNRRDFLRGSLLLPVCATAATTTLKISLNAYSFNKLLNDAIRERGPGTTLPKLLDFAAANKFDGFDATGYYFPGYPALPPDCYVPDLKQNAADLGLGI